MSVSFLNFTTVEQRILLTFILFFQPFVMWIWKQRRFLCPLFRKLIFVYICLKFLIDSLEKFPSSNKSISGLFFNSKISEKWSLDQCFLNIFEMLWFIKVSPLANVSAQTSFVRHELTECETAWFLKLYFSNFADGFFRQGTSRSKARSASLPAQAVEWDVCWQWTLLAEKQS